MSERFIYLDHAATTPMSAEAFASMEPFFSKTYGNPSSVYSIAREAKAGLDAARAEAADALGVTADEMFFTAGGTEADNWAVKGAAAANAKKGKHVIASAIEHHAVMDACKSLERQGYEVEYLPVGEDGIVSPDSLRAALRDDTSLVSVMAANNEIGTLQPIAELARIAHERGALFHTDAVQAVGAIELAPAAMGVDLMSISAHKFYGPKGVGALYVRKGARIARFIDGGGQERGRRAGTENVAGIAGMAAALRIAVRDTEKNAARLRRLRDRTIEGVLAAIPDSRLNGSLERRLPNNAHFAFRGIEGESLLLMLDMKGIGASSGSACTSGSLDPSHVLLAIGLPHERAHGSLRVTFGVGNTEDDVDELLRALPPIVARLREMSPLYAG